MAKNPDDKDYIAKHHWKGECWKLHPDQVPEKYRPKANKGRKG